MVKRVTYLAGPIFLCSDSEAKDWRAQASATLKAVRDPMVRDYRGREAEAYVDIVDRDKEDIDACSHVLAVCPKPSVGTSMEILYAWERNKTVVLVVPDGAVSPWLRYHSHAMFPTLEEALSWLTSKSR